MSTSPTQRSLKHARSLGFHPFVTEHWNAYARRRIDLYGFVDLVVLDDKPGLLGVQACDSTSVSKRKAKIGEIQAATHWLRSGLRLEIWSWRKLVEKRGKPGKKLVMRRCVASLDECALAKTDQECAMEEHAHEIRWSEWS